MPNKERNNGWLLHCELTVSELVSLTTYLLSLHHHDRKDWSMLRNPPPKPKTKKYRPHFHTNVGT